MTMQLYRSIRKDIEFVFRACITGLIYFVALASGAMAQDARPSSSQSVLSYEQANMLTSGRGLTFPGMEDPAFVNGAMFAFKHKERAQTVLEFFEVRQDGKVCVDFGSFSNRCGIFVKNESLFFLLTKERDRFPMHFEFTFD